MRALQMHYTSCRRGQSGSAGFQTRAMTAGLGADERREIERRGLYRPPRDARQEPDEEEIARDFPRAFRWYRLESGRRAVTRSCYTGRDYSGRWGNFFAHTLVLESDDLADCWPIDTYEWPGWRERLPVEEDTEEPPLPLPAVDLGELSAADSFGSEELRDFLGEEPGRRDVLAKMCRAVILGRTSARALVVRDTPARGLYWIACLQKLFPPAHAGELSWSTYQDDPRGCAAINATVGQTDFAFDDAERRYRFYMFDLTTGAHSEVAESDDDYPAFAARWLVEEPARLAEFFAFMRYFDHREPEPALLAAVHLFELAGGRLPPLDGVRLAAILGFVERHVTPAGQSALLTVLGQAAERAAGSLPPEEQARLVRFLAAGARATGQPEHRALAYGSWRALLEGPVLGRGVGIAAAEAAWKNLRQELAPHARELATSLLAAPLWREGSALRKVSREIVALLLRLAWESLETLGRLPVWDQKEIGVLAQAAMTAGSDATAGAQVILENVPREAEPLAAIACRLATLGSGLAGDESASAVAAGRALGRVLATLSAPASADIRRRLEIAGAWDLLFGEWVELCAGVGDPLVVFERYRRSVLLPLPEFHRQRGHRVAATLLERLPAAARPMPTLRWLRDGEIELFPPELVAECVRSANLAVPLDPANPEGDAAAAVVAAAAIRLGLALRPDRPLLRRALRAAKGTETSLKLGLGEIRSSVADLAADDYLHFVNVFLPAALARTGSQKEHEQVLTAACRSDRLDLCDKTYLGFFKAKHKAAWPECLQGALRFWLRFDAREGDESRGLAPLERTARQGLVEALARLGAKDLESVRLRLGKARLDGRAAARWEEIEAALDKRKRSRWAKLVGVFVRD